MLNLCIHHIYRQFSAQFPSCVWYILELIVRQTSRMEGHILLSIFWKMLEIVQIIDHMDGYITNTVKLKKVYQILQDNATF